MLPDNEYADLVERLRFDLAPKPELAPSLPDIRTVADWTNVYIRNGETYEKWTAIEGKWVRQDLEEIMIQDFLLELGKGNIPGHKAENKFGQVTNADSGVITDVWDAPAQPVWLAPTGARVHEILSTSDEDSDTGGAIAQGDGARTVKIYGLNSWDSKESTEIVIMDGTDGVDTVNSYVIIHRMEVVTFGTSVQAGIITAVADVDGTVTARIGPPKGQTMMAVYGIPSSQVAYITNFSASLARSSPQGAEAGVILMRSTDVKVDPSVFTFKHTCAIKTDGSTSYNHPFNPYKKFEGPCIIKMAFTSGDNDTFGDASFDIILVDNNI